MQLFSQGFFKKTIGGGERESTTMHQVKFSLVSSLSAANAKGFYAVMVLVIPQ